MRRGTVIMLVILFALIFSAAAAQLLIASQDRPACPGPIASPNALPSPDTNAECGE